MLSSENSRVNINTIIVTATLINNTLVFLTSDASNP